ncbi:hypothetical protein PUN28_013752 [Cardiocondyla obscurior]|uniref:Uncharacterized protein n=1 Tax=Cardiocondyla obscurior TaxID=286306 RepID=A0AAW2F2S5_9HYME
MYKIEPALEIQSARGNYVGVLRFAPRKRFESSEIEIHVCARLYLTLTCSMLLQSLGHARCPTIYRNSIFMLNWSMQLTRIDRIRKTADSPPCSHSSVRRR